MSSASLTHYVRFADNGLSWKSIRGITSTRYDSKPRNYVTTQANAFPGKRAGPGALSPSSVV